MIGLTGPDRPDAGLATGPLRAGARRPPPRALALASPSRCAPSRTFAERHRRGTPTVCGLCGRRAPVVRGRSLHLRLCGCLHRRAGVCVRAARPRDVTQKKGMCWTVQPILGAAAMPKPPYGAPTPTIPLEGAILGIGNWRGMRRG